MSYRTGDQMKKILYVHHSDSKCGSFRSLNYLISGIDKREYDCHVLFFNDPLCKIGFEKSGAKTIQDSRIRPFHGSVVSGMPFRLFVANRFWTPRNLYLAKKYIQEIKPDILHINSTCLFQFAMMAKRIDKNIKVVCHVREPLLKGYSGWILKHFCMKYVDRFISIDKYDATTVDKKLGKTDIIYNFVNFEQYNSDVRSNVLRKELKILDNEVIFLYLARFAKCNGTYELIKAVKEIKESSFKFVFVGEQYGGKSQYEALVRDTAGGSDNIFILPFRADVPNIIASSDVMISPFVEPHFSRSIIEAAAMGVPSIGTNIAGVNELIEDGKTGILFNPLDFLSINKAIKKLGEDASFRKQLGINAEKKALKEFNSKINIEKTINVYRKLFEDNESWH